MSGGKALYPTSSNLARSQRDLDEPGALDSLAGSWSARRMLLGGIVTLQQQAATAGCIRLLRSEDDQNLDSSTALGSTACGYEGGSWPFLNATI